MPPVVETAGPGRQEALPDTLEQGDLQLLEDPEGPLPPRDCMEFGEQLVSARVIPVEREDDQPEHGTGGEAEDQ